MRTRVDEREMRESEERTKKCRKERERIIVIRPQRRAKWITVTNRKEMSCYKFNFLHLILPPSLCI